MRTPQQQQQLVGRKAVRDASAGSMPYVQIDCVCVWGGGGGL